MITICLMEDDAKSSDNVQDVSQVERQIVAK